MQIHGRPFKAFERHVPEQFAAWKAKLATGEAKMKGVKSLLPQEIVAQYLERSEGDALLEVQWRALVDGLDAAVVDTLQHTLVLAIPSDVLQASTSERQVEAVVIALALLTLSSSSSSPTGFDNRVLKAQPRPELLEIAGATLFERVQSMQRILRARGDESDASSCCCFTRAFRAILEFARSHNVPRDELPRRVVAVASVDFESIDSRGFERSYQALQQKLHDVNYAMPHLVVWNLNGSSSSSERLGVGDTVTLVSGFSLANFKRVVRGCALTPLEIVLEAIENARYDAIMLPS